MNYQSSFLDHKTLNTPKHLEKDTVPHNSYWPNKISNEALYERCKMRPLTERAEKSRWKMLGHIEAETVHQHKASFTLGGMFQQNIPR